MFLFLRRIRAQHISILRVRNFRRFNDISSGEYLIRNWTP